MISENEVKEEEDSESFQLIEETEEEETPAHTREEHSAPKKQVHSHQDLNGLKT